MSVHIWSVYSGLIHEEVRYFDLEQGIAYGNDYGGNCLGSANHLVFLSDPFGETNM